MKWKIGVLVFVLVMIMSGFNPVQAEWTPGKTYDKSNYQEIEDLLFPYLINRVKSGDFILKTAELEYEPLITDPYFVEGTKKNEGKFEVNAEGYRVLKTTGEFPGFFTGFPFPTIDPKDPNVAEKIMENFAERINMTQGNLPIGIMQFLSADSNMLERELIMGGTYMYYNNRYHGPIPNPQGFLKQNITEVFAPMDVRGTVTLSWEYEDNKESTTFVYVPMLRRVRRTSSAARSDSSMGGDTCTDDASGWGGKNQDMTFKFLGEDRKMVLFGSTKLQKLRDNPDGSLGFENDQFVYYQHGWEVPGFQGASWCPVSAVWSPRDVWLIEMHAKDDYYNYGKMILVIEKVDYAAYMKIIWDRSGTYWKTMLLGRTFHKSPSGRTTDFTGLNSGIDDKTRHGTLYQNKTQPGRRADYVLGIDVVHPGLYTTGGIQQRSK